MSLPTFRSLHLEQRDAVLWVTFDHPPINLMDGAMIGDLVALGHWLVDADTIRCAVFQSANPEFFIAHADIEMIQRLPTGVAEPSTELGPFHAMIETFRTLPMATIGKIAGRARGGGSEFLLSLDMRFAAIGQAVLAQPEVGVGIIPGGGGTQRLHRLVGRGRALEIVLGCEDFDAELAERYGYVNRAIPADELDDFVAQLAGRIASFPADAIRLAKASLDAAMPSPEPGLLVEGDNFIRSAGSPGAVERMAKYMAKGGQTREVELEMGKQLAGLGD
jgi:enoyl-CoA hydratase/carnithine racemase